MTSRVYENGSPLDPAVTTGRRRWLFGLGVAVLVCAAYAVGRGSRPSVVEAASAGGRKVLYYVDPMHPAYRSERPGKAPDCGMDLEPVYAGGVPAQAAAMSPGSVQLTPDQEQAVRLQTETVQTRPGTHELHTAGRVTPDEALTYGVSAGVDGWVRRVFSDRTGTQVKRGEALTAFFSKDVSAPQQAYVYALESYERLKQTPSPAADSRALVTRQLAITRDNLQFLGMGDSQIDELGRTHGEIFDINLTAPADGQIVERHVAVGQRFMKGELLYRIANLERVWVLADIYPGDAAFSGAFASARVRIEGLPPLDAKVSTVPPQFDEQGRTGRLRLEVNNPRGSLLPGMIVDVDVDVPARAAMTVHADALIDSGTTRRVFVALGDGQYEAREVETGWQEGDRVEIRGGLKAGERVVTAGAFLLDSESRMKNATDVRKPINRHTP
jgi:Cu(I)/Ag(I) efflux system membrane fusion protein